MNSFSLILNNSEQFSENLIKKKITFIYLNNSVKD